MEPVKTRLEGEHILLMECIKALAAIDAAMGGCIEGCGDIFYNSPDKMDPVISNLVNKVMEGQSTYIWARTTLRNWDNMQ